MYPNVPDVWHVARPVFVQARMANTRALSPSSCRAYSSILYFCTLYSDARASYVLKGSATKTVTYFPRHEVLPSRAYHERHSNGGCEVYGD